MHERVSECMNHVGMVVVMRGGGGVYATKLRDCKLLYLHQVLAICCFTSLAS